MSDSRIEDLYALPLGEFTPARNALAKQLRSEGDSAAARQVSALAKPNLTAWAINQLCRSNFKLLGELLDVGERLMKAQEEMLSGGTGEDVRALNRQRHKVIARLRPSASGTLELAGHPSAPAHLEKVAETLYAAATDPSGRELLHSGMFTRGLEPAGFEPPNAVIASVRPKGRPPKPAAPQPEDTSTAPARRVARDLDRLAERSERKAQRLEAVAAKAEAEADRAREESSVARRDAIRARAEAERAARKAGLSGE